MKDTLLIGWTTFADENAAKTFAHGLVQSELAVCVQIEPNIQSVYRWKGEIQQDTECRCMVKFLKSKSDAIEHFIKTAHPYDTPEWVVVLPEHIAPRYLAWAMGEG